MRLVNKGRRGLAQLIQNGRGALLRCFCLHRLVLRPRSLPHAGNNANNQRYEYCRGRREHHFVAPKTAKQIYFKWRWKNLRKDAPRFCLPSCSCLQAMPSPTPTGDFNVASSWNPPGVPAGVTNAFNDSGSNNVVLIQPGDPVWSPWDRRAGDGANASSSYLQTGSTLTSMVGCD
jgi:hypothetical protein